MHINEVPLAAALFHPSTSLPAKTEGSYLQQKNLKNPGNQRWLKCVEQQFGFCKASHGSELFAWLWLSAVTVQAKNNFFVSVTLPSLEHKNSVQGYQSDLECIFLHHHCSLLPCHFITHMVTCEDHEKVRGIQVSSCHRRWTSDFCNISLKHADREA